MNTLHAIYLHVVIEICLTGPKIDTGKRNRNKRTIHPDLYRTMSEYYDDLRRVSNVSSILCVDTFNTNSIIIPCIYKE